MDQHIDINEAMDRIKKAIGDEGYLKVMANLYGPLVRRVLGLEDFLLAVINVTIETAREEEIAMYALGFYKTASGTWTKLNEIPKISLQ